MSTPNDDINNLSGSLTPYKDYRLKQKLGGGSFGVVYAAERLEGAEGTPVAVKVEKRKTKHPQLVYESGLIMRLQNNPGIANIVFTAADARYRYLGMTRLGCSLEELFRQNKYQFSTNQICGIAIQMLERIKLVHSKGIIHRDIKPDNFLCSPLAPIIYIIDFGLAKLYIDDKTGQHIPLTTNRSLTGTARYASINAHFGFEQSRRDDLEAIGHVILYFFKRGVLPWQGIKAEGKEEKYELIAQKKKSVSISTLCKGLPPELEDYMTYCRTLDFTADPDYDYLKSLFRKVLSQMGERSNKAYWNSKHTSSVTTKDSEVASIYDHRGKLEKGKSRKRHYRCFTFHKSKQDSG